MIAPASIASRVGGVISNHRTLRFLLQHDRPRGYFIAMAHVPNAQSDQITAAQFAVDAQIKQRQFSQSVLHLQTDANRPDSLSLNGNFWPMSLCLFHASWR